MLREGESNVLENALKENIDKKSSYFERVSFGSSKKDPMEGRVSGDVWKVQGNQLLKRKTGEKNV